MSNDKHSQTLGSQNQEWELADLIHLISAEIEEAQDKLQVRSYNRRLMMSVKEMKLDLQVTARHDSQGKLLFRTASQWENHVSTLKLEFGNFLDTQAQEIQKSKSSEGEELRSLNLLSNIDSPDIKILNTFSINSIADLERSTQTPALLSDLSQKTGIDEARIRAWRQLPYISTVQPEKGPPGSVIQITGDNFAAGKTKVIFQNQPININTDQSTETRLTVEIPKEATGKGVLIVEVNGEPTNAKTWEVALSDLAVEDIILEPSESLQPGIILFQARIANRGNLDTADAFEIRWELKPPEGSSPDSPRLIACPKLPAGEEILTQPIEFNCQESGTYTIICTADPEGKIADRCRKNQIFTKAFNVLSTAG